MAFIPKTTNNTVILKRSYETREGTFTAGHRFEVQESDMQLAAFGQVELKDADGRILIISRYELERLT